MKSKTISIKYMSIEEISESIDSNNTLIKNLTSLVNLNTFDEFRLQKAIDCKKKMKQRMKFAESHGKEYVMLYNDEILNYFNIKDMLYGNK